MLAFREPVEQRCRQLTELVSGRSTADGAPEEEAIWPMAVCTLPPRYSSVACSGG
jgi:hypothetical protein